MDNPIDIRRALQRFPRWTQPVWTAITGLASPGDAARPRRAWMHIAAQVFVYVLSDGAGRQRHAQPADAGAFLLRFP